jgi:hypothetical protein
VTSIVDQARAKLHTDRSGRAAPGVSRGRNAAPSRGEAADWLGTAGWAAKGVVYLLVAVIAAQLALSHGAEGESANKQGALQSLAEKPFGGALLVIVVIGLFAYAAYRLLAVFLPRSTSGSSGRDRDRAEERGKQAIHVGSAVAYAAFAVQGIGILVGRSKGGSEESTRTWSAVAMSSTIGTIALFLVGAGFVVFAGAQAHKAWKRSFMEKLESPNGPVLTRRRVEVVGVVGLAARAVVAALLGLFVILSVVRHDPAEVRGLDGTLRTVQGAPSGPPVLLLVALGLAAYGVFSLVCARCRRHELG